MEFVTFQTDNFSEEYPLLREIKEEVKEEDEWETDEVAEANASLLGTYSSSVPVDTETGANYDTMDGIVEIKQEVLDEDGTQLFTDASSVPPILKTASVISVKRRNRSTTKPKTRACIKMPQNPYQCNLCTAKFPHVYKLEPHIMNMHKQCDVTVALYRCAICSSALHEAGELRHHVVDHFSVNVPSKGRKTAAKGRTRNQRYSGMAEHKCDECGVCFTAARWLKEHVQLHACKSSFSCEVCNKIFSTKSQLTAHIQSHANGKIPESENGELSRGGTARLQTCNICGKSVVDLRKHHLTHSGTRSRPRPCKICGKFVSDMYKHQMVHRGQPRPTQRQTCDICGKNVANVHRHKLTHQDERSDVRPCGICGKSVSDLYKHLKTHNVDASESQTCEVCGEVVEDMDTHTHQETAYRRKRNHYRPCKVCGKVVADMYKHVKTHMKQTPNQKPCDICGKAVVDLYRHRKIHSGLVSQLQKCDICGKSIVDMYKHKLVHRGIERPLRTCTVCGKSVQDLRRHRQIHDGFQQSNRYLQPCDVCGKVVTNLRTHLKTHEERGQEHMCLQCGRCYSSASSLKVHINTHSSHKNFVCAECGKRYFSKTALSTHMWIHSVDPRYQCTICNKAFRWHVTWKRHQWTHGIGVNQTHSCPVCTKYFASPYLLRDHMRTHSGEKPYMCSQCGRRFAYKSSLLSHQKCSHSTKKSICPECGKAVRAPRMSEHMRSMHRHSLHKCPQCDMEFRQRDWLDCHILCHYGTRPFICEDCSDDKDDTLLGGSQPTAGTDNLCLPDDLESYVRAECETNAEMSDVEVPRPDDADGSRLERKSSGTKAPNQPSDLPVPVHDEGSSQMEADDVVDRNKLSSASEGGTVSRSDTKEEVRVGDDTCWNTSGGELHIPPVKSDDRCIRCNKLRPLEQCPVCQCMYPSVAVHIGLHSVRKTHTPSALLPIHPTDQDSVSSPTGLPVEKTG